MCKSPDEIDWLMSTIFFTYYNVVEKVDLGSKHNIGQRPTVIKDVIAG